jgi:hypothetical protein
VERPRPEAPIKAHDERAWTLSTRRFSQALNFPSKKVPLMILARESKFATADRTSLFSEFINERDGALRQSRNYARRCRRNRMSGFKTKIVAALALATAHSAPALAGMNGTESINRIQSAQRAQAPERQAYAAWQTVDPAPPPGSRRLAPRRRTIVTTITAVGDRFTERGHWRGSPPAPSRNGRGSFRHSSRE